MPSAPRLLLILLAAGLGLPARAQTTLTLPSPNPQPNGQFGYAIATVPDTDGDGVDDLLVGAPVESYLGLSAAGRAYLYSGATGALLYALGSVNAQANGQFGYAVAGTEDLNGDGRGDLLVGHPGFDLTGIMNAGRVEIFSGATGASIAVAYSPNVQTDGVFGSHLAGVPDVDSDGRGNFLVGASYEDVGGNLNAGRAYLFGISSGGIPFNLRELGPGAGPEAQGLFGSSVASVPDADGDGVADLLVGAPYETRSSGTTPRAGRAYLFSGATGSMLRVIGSPDPETDGTFGYTVAGVPDVTGDGRGDLLIGAPFEDHLGQEDAGRAYLYSGATGALVRGLGPGAGPEAGGRFGVAVAAVPDTDGDGRSDLLVGADNETRSSGTTPATGRAYLFSGGTGSVLRIFGSLNVETNGNFGESVTGMGDLDGDGRGDIAVGAPFENPLSTTDAGRVYLYRGPGATGAFTVNSTADPGFGACDATECTLREAIIAANQTPNVDQPDEIHFAIPGAGLHTIALASSLPEITDPVVIDGYTQPGSSPNTLAVGTDAVLQVELNGNGANNTGLFITAGGSTVRGLVINRCGAYGVSVITGGGNTIAGNWIGTDATGTADLPNFGAGIYVLFSSGNTIGGTSPADRNVIVGGANPAVFDAGTAGGGHTIQGNYIGTNAAGTAALGMSGIVLGTANSLIGGTEPGARNVISTQGRPAIALFESDASGTLVQGNFIGVTADGTAALAPTSGTDGILVQRAPGTVIGGTEPGAGNVITTRGNGIILFGTPTSGVGTTIQGNYLGTDATGTATLLPSTAAGAGVRIEDVGGNRIGGTDAGAGNVIAGYLAGIQFFGARAGNLVEGNRIGTDAAGTAALPNAEGILFAGGTGDDGNTIGGRVPGAGNVIAGNLGDGVRLNGSTNVLQGNRIGVAADGTTPLGNGGHGIEIGSGSGNLIGGTAPGAGNVIAYNGLVAGRHGVVALGGTGNAVEGNAIYGNGRIAINLFGTDDGTGATPNDPGDADTGPNNLQNTPQIASASLIGGQITVTYLVDSAPANAAYPLRAEFFRALNGADGAAFLGTDMYSTADFSGCGSAPCSKTVTFTPDAPLALTDALTATATDAAGNTSEFTALARPVPTEDAPSVPAETALRAPWPNPTTDRAMLSYDLAAAGRVRLVVYDLLGREVAVLLDTEEPAGRYEAEVGADRLAAGTYVARLTASGLALTRRLTVLR